MACNGPCSNTYHAPHLPVDEVMVSFYWLEQSSRERGVRTLAVTPQAADWELRSRVRDRPEIDLSNI